MQSPHDRRCLTCAHAILRGVSKDIEHNKLVRAMVDCGAACCGLSAAKASFVAFGKCCEQWAAAEPAVVAGRLAWAEKQRTAA